MIDVWAPVRRCRRLSGVARYAIWEWDVLVLSTSTTSPRKCLRNPQGREGPDTRSRQQPTTADEAGLVQRERPNAYTVLHNACMLGRAGWPARLRGALIHTH